VKISARGLFCSAPHTVKNTERCFPSTFSFGGEGGGGGGVTIFFCFIVFFFFCLFGKMNFSHL